MGSGNAREQAPGRLRLARVSIFAVCCFAAQLAAACGGSSSTSSPQQGGHAGAGTSGSTQQGGACAATQSCGAGNQTGGTDAQGGSTNQNQNGGAPAGDAGGDANPGGAGSTTPDQPTLGDACSPPGALACAGPHQKLTIVCGGAKTWDTNQTCASGEFCESTPGPDVGLCKKPDADCASRQPGDAFCGGADSKDAMKCDADGLAAGLVEHCNDKCVDGKCETNPPYVCPTNIVYSCDPMCPGDGSATLPACFELCPKIPRNQLPPLLDLAAAEPGVSYSVVLPPVPADSLPCPCSTDSASQVAWIPAGIQAVAFRLPASPTGSGGWRIRYPKDWTVRSSFLNGPVEGCDSLDSSKDPDGDGCVYISPSTFVFLFTTTALSQPEAAEIQLGAKCP